MKTVVFLSTRVENLWKNLVKSLWKALWKVFARIGRLKSSELPKIYAIV